MAKINSICVCDLDQARCLRQEKALENALAQRGLEKIVAISNYGRGYISRAGIEDSLPSLEIEGRYWCRKPDEELTEETIGNLLDAFIAKGIIEA